MRLLLTVIVGALLIAPAVAQARPAKEPSTRERIVREWSRLLNSNDNEGVARLFALPATIVQGQYLYTLKTRAQLALYHAGLPCAGRVTSVKVKGRFATVQFVLGDRKGSSPCSGSGAQVAARFEIVAGKIKSWVQLPPEEPAPDGPKA